MCRRYLGGSLASPCHYCTFVQGECGKRYLRSVNRNSKTENIKKTVLTLISNTKQRKHPTRKIAPRTITSQTIMSTLHFHRINNNHSQCHLCLLRRHQCSQHKRRCTGVLLPSPPRIHHRLFVPRGEISASLRHRVIRHQRNIGCCTTQGLLFTIGLEECARHP